ncbi:hypothetical protein DYB32_006601 [Aphanomyces invadans]|uniref:Uncharacterized protein n=1 Tax=Aphanomyces invadans TaxID=157072 RepID=A0A3R6ZMX4_9STRA|nr:hypothetical protein DYB32_006601 [Aphanomyces invadans]
MDDLGAIVLDNGSGLVKVGFSGEDMPRGTFQTSFGQVRNPDWLVSHNAGVKPDREYFVGKECHAVREHLDIVDPIQRGVVTDWDAMEKVWDYTFEHEMRMNPEAISMPVLCTWSSPTPKAQLEKTAQIMFESFKTTAFYSMQQCVLSLFASGRTRGLIIEAGHGSSHAVPIFEGYALPHATLHLGIGGFDITKHLELLLNRHGHALKSFTHTLFADLKESHCYTPPMTPPGMIHTNNYDSSNNSSKPYELPDGTVISIHPDCRTKATDILFHPNQLADDHPAKHAKSLPDLASHRLHQELQTKLSESDIRIVPDYNSRERGYNTHRKMAAWIGGSMFASLPTFKDIQITRQEWEEYHESIIDRKCF